jgi:hypothetical protein
VEDAAGAVLVEHADARRLLAREPVRAVVVVDVALGHFVLRERHVIVVVEVVPVGRHPLEAPAHALLEGLDLGQRRPRNRHQRHVPGIQVHDVAVEIVGRPGAARATLLPLRPEHEVIDDQLAAAVEEVGESLLALRPVEVIGLVDLDPGQLAPLGAQAVAQAREFLLLAQELLACGKPLIA